MQTMEPKPSTFLGELAASLYARHRGDFASLALLFPSRRARLFFAEELTARAQEPIWEPEWLTVEPLMEELSGLHLGDRLRLIVELYHVYGRYHTEEFDRFYFWGEMLLSDFDMIDKYRVDAESLFANISDLKELEADLSYLTPEQRELINRFWEGVLNDSSDTEERQRFLGIWRTLWPIYRDFRARLLELGFGYGGLVQRVAAERLETGESSLRSDRHYVVAGFNALTSCEKVLFDHLRGVGAEFYWDYDESYLRDEVQEAGMFLRENLRRYPEPVGEINHRSLSKEQKIEILSAASDAVQCKVVSELLDSFRERNEEGVPQPLDRHTAVVLTDEELLMPLLYSLTPSEGQLQPDAVNVTMGFPLKQSVVYTLVERLLNLQQHGRKGRGGHLFYHADVTGLLAHPLLNVVPGEVLQELQQDIVKNRRITVEASHLACTPVLEEIFRPATEWRTLSDYLISILGLLGGGVREESGLGERTATLMLLSEEITKLRNSIEICQIDISLTTYLSLLRRHLQSLRIPFEGEPLNGVQVMGILETRNLDFDRVIILSMTDDNFPGPLDNHASYIPYNLRAAYGLPTPEHHEGVHAYYFYRLLQRAREVHLCYCSKSDFKTTGEPSRYIRQLEYESGLPLRFSEVGIDVNLPEESPFEVEKSGSVREQLEAFLREEKPHTLSPTAFARYLACPLKFYFASVAKLREREEVSEEVDNPLFGTVLHASMEQLYASLRGRELAEADFDALLEGDRVARAVRRAIEQEFFCGEERPDEEYPGNLLLVRSIVERYIREGIIPYDRAHAGFTVLGTETPVACDFSIDAERSVRFAGLSDRLDLLPNGQVRVVDYKTGSVQLEFNGLEELFLGKYRSSKANLFQTLLYALMVWYSEGRNARPALYYVRAMNNPDFSPWLRDKKQRDEEVSYALYGEKFEELLREKLKELFDWEIPFRPCSEQESDTICNYCDFRTLCRR